MNNQEMQNAIKDLQKQMKELHAASSIPFEIDVAFKRRLGVTEIPVMVISSKGVDTEDVTVNEGGSNSYAVMNDPDIFLQITVSGTTYYIPAFTS